MGNEQAGLPKKSADMRPNDAGVGAQRSAARGRYGRLSKNRILAQPRQARSIVPELGLGTVTVPPLNVIPKILRTCTGKWV
jgi:hypothetical protein